MKQKELLFGNYKIKGLKGNDHCTCFKERIWGILKNVPGHSYSIKTVRRCEWLLLKFFNDKFGSPDWNTEKSSVWNWDNHPEYLYYIQQTKEWMKRVNNATKFDEHPELTKWLKTLSFDHQAIIISYWLIINR